MDPEKVTAKRLNCYATFLGFIAFLGANAKTGQIITGFV